MGIKKDKDGNVIADDKEKDPPGEGDPGQGSGDGDGDGDPGDGKELSPEEAKAALALARKEAAAARIKNKDLMSKFTMMEEKFSKMEKGIKSAVGLEDGDELTPEKMKTTLDEKDAYIVQLESQMALLNAADEHGIPAEGRKYFALLIDEAAQALEEGEELSEEAVTKVVTEVKARFGKAGNSSVDGNGKGGGNPPPAGGGDKVSVEKFAKMTTTEKSVLYQKQPELYAELFRTAKEKRLLI